MSNVADHSLGKEGTPPLIELANRDNVLVHVVIRESIGCCGHARNRVVTTPKLPFCDWLLEGEITTALYGIDLILLAGVNENYEPERRDILKMDPLPNVEAAYALIRRGAARRGIWGIETDRLVDRDIGSRLVTHTSQHDGEAVGITAKGFRPSTRKLTFVSLDTRNGGKTTTNHRKMVAVRLPSSSATPRSLAIKIAATVVTEETTDIRTGDIIGCGTERRGLYYVDEIAQKSIMMLATETAPQAAWLWHHRLGHPSAGYLKL
ncbi:hypothetical protein C2S51_038077 [Perilla frutescens var. frutescens]|nr:hypothetical protein C2S51_038077 [Perilla frutescens var. frutescens]